MLYQMSVLGWLQLSEAKGCQWQTFGEFCNQTYFIQPWPRVDVVSGIFGLLFVAIDKKYGRAGAKRQCET